MGELLSTKDAARQLNKSVQSVTRLLKKEELGGVKVGTQWITTPDDISNYLKNRKVKQRGRSYPGRRRRRNDD